MEISECIDDQHPWSVLICAGWEKLVDAISESYGLFEKFLAGINGLAGPHPGYFVLVIVVVAFVFIVRKELPHILEYIGKERESQRKHELELAKIQDKAAARAERHARNRQKALEKEQKKTGNN